MIEHEFLNELASIITSVLKSEKYPFLRKEVSSIGHFNYRVFLPKKMFRQRTLNFIRMLMNMAMGMRERDFRNMCQKLVDRIVKAAESEESDIINAEHGFLKRYDKWWH